MSGRSRRNSISAGAMVAGLTGPSVRLWRLDFASSISFKPRRASLGAQTALGLAAMKPRDCEGQGHSSMAIYRSRLRRLMRGASPETNVSIFDEGIARPRAMGGRPAIGWLRSSGMARNQPDKLRASPVYHEFDFRRCCSIGSIGQAAGEHSLFPPLHYGNQIHSIRKRGPLRGQLISAADLATGNTDGAKQALKLSRDCYRREQNWRGY